VVGFLNRWGEGGRNITPREDEFLHGNDVEKEGGKL